MLFPMFPLAAGRPGRRNPAARRSPASNSGQGPIREKKKSSRGLCAKSSFFFFLFSKPENL
jgi:hypothetical protein